MAMIKGIPVTLYEAAKIGTDAFGAPSTAEKTVLVDNVLVTPVSGDAVVNELQLSGKRAVYELCIPKGDVHNWENRRVDFFGVSWHTFGAVTEYIEENLPLRWNKKVKVERYV